MIIITAIMIIIVSLIIITLWKNSFLDNHNSLQKIYVTAVSGPPDKTKFALQ